MICLRRIFERLAAFVGGPQDCGQQIAVEFEAMEAGADVLKAVHRFLLALLRIGNGRLTQCQLSRPVKTSTFQPSDLYQRIAFSSWARKVGKDVSITPRFFATMVQRDSLYPSMAAILNARSYKRNSPFVPISAGGNG
jgi:hypothetical protein